MTVILLAAAAWIAILAIVIGVCASAQLGEAGERTYPREKAARQDVEPTAASRAAAPSSQTHASSGRLAA
jgi:hypothetical protein